MAKSGFIYGNAPNVNSTAEILKKYNKMNGKSYWGTAYSEINKAYNNGLYQLDNTMANNMARQNYNTMQAKSTAAQMNLGSGDLARYNTYYDNALEQAYNSYKSSYNTGVSELNTNISKAYDAVNDELTTQSQNTVDLTNFGYDWLYDMANRVRSPLFNDVNDVAVGFDWLFSNDIDEETGRRRLYSRSELNNLLYDENNTLNAQGQRFYDMIFNGAYGSTKERYTDYLAENNPELLEWASSINQYDDSGLDNWNYIKRNFMGIESDDYNPVNYFEQLTEQEKIELYKSSDESVKKLLTPNENLVDEEAFDFVTSTGASVPTDAIQLDANFILNSSEQELIDKIFVGNKPMALGMTKEEYLRTHGFGNSHIKDYDTLKEIAKAVADGIIEDGEYIKFNLSGRRGEGYYMAVDGKLVTVTPPLAYDALGPHGTVNAVSKLDIEEYSAFKKIASVNYETFVNANLPDEERKFYDIPRGVEQIKFINGDAYYYEPVGYKWVKLKRR